MTAAISARLAPTNELDAATEGAGLWLGRHNGGHDAMRDEDDENEEAGGEERETVLCGGPSASMLEEHDAPRL